MWRGCSPPLPRSARSSSSSRPIPRARSACRTSTTEPMSKLGLIAGGGGLPLEVLKACQTADRPVFVIRLKGYADPALAGVDGLDAGLAELGKTIKALKAARCQAVCFAG